jgi:predicted secreted Zn-dependent protease
VAVKEWNRFADAVDTHENGHVDAYYAEAQALAKELTAMSATGQGKDEKTARVVAQRALVEAMKKAYGGDVLDKRAGASAKSYDAKTKHGESQGAVLDGRIA